MKEFYLVSLNQLQINQKLELNTEKNAVSLWHADGLYSENDVKAKIDELYPHGVSKHGIQYLSEKFDFPCINGKDFVPNMAMIEWTFELIRKHSFKKKPSRFVSVFGCDNFEQAKLFKKKNRDNQGNIYKVLAENSFKADMNLLLIGRSVIGNQVLAEKYWAGESSENPFWEILMTGDIEVIEQME